jgi:hypothetical protein
MSVGSRRDMASKREKEWGDWEEVDRSEGHYLITANEGKGGAGKSHFVLTGPEPVCMHLFDPGGLDGLKKNPLFKKKDIRVLIYNSDLSKYAEDDRQKASEEVLEKFKENQAIALKNARTIGWDKEDKVWELLRYARLGATSDRPNLYYELNLEYEGFFHDAGMAGVNMCLIRGMKESWGKTGSNREGKATYGSTGEEQPRGQKQVPELVQVVLRHRWDADVNDFVATIHEKCRIGDAKKLIGREFQSLTFKELGEAIYPETEDMDPSPWE